MIVNASPAPARGLRGRVARAALGALALAATAGPAFPEAPARTIEGARPVEAPADLDKSRGELDLRRDFGARGDGKADDTRALQAFLDACVATSNRCFAPPGTYLNDGVTLDASKRNIGIVIRGSGAGATIWKLRPGAKGHALTIVGAGGYGNQSRTRLADLTIDGSGVGLDGIHFADRGGDARDLGAYNQGADLRDMTIKFTGRDGIYVGRNVNAGQTFNVWVAHPGRNGLTLIAGADWRFTNSQFYGAQRAGIAVAGIADNGAGLARIATGRPHGLASGTAIDLWGLNGARELQGHWIVDAVDATHLDLRGSAYRPGWANNGWVVPALEIKALARGPNTAPTTGPGTGSGTAGENSVRVTLGLPHGLRNGDQVYVRDVTSTPVNGHWIVTVVDERTLDLQGAKLFKPYAGGGTLRPATFGVAIVNTASNFFSDCTIYSSMIGFSVTSNSGNITKFTGGEINGNWMGGFSIASLGNFAPNAIQNVQLASNSAIRGGAYSDILLMDTGATSIVGNEFVLQGVPSRNLVEAISPTDSITWFGNAYTTNERARPYAEAPLGNVKANSPDRRGD